MRTNLYLIGMLLLGVALIWYCFFALNKIIPQAKKDYQSWKQKPDTVITIKNGHYDTTITIKK